MSPASGGGGRSAAAALEAQAFCQGSACNSSFCAERRPHVCEMRGFVLNMMGFTLKMRGSVLQMMDFAVRRVPHATSAHDSVGGGGGRGVSGEDLHHQQQRQQRHAAGSAQRHPATSHCTPHSQAVPACATTPTWHLVSKPRKSSWLGSGQRLASRRRLGC